MRHESVLTPWCFSVCCQDVLVSVPNWAALPWGLKDVERSMTMTLMTWLREEKAATEQTSICQLCYIGNAHVTHGTRTYGADAAGEGWEQGSTRITILSSGSQKWNINSFLIAMIFPFPYSSHPAHRKNSLTLHAQKNPTDLNPRNIFYGWSVSTSARQLPTTQRLFSFQLLVEYFWSMPLSQILFPNFC